MTEARVVDLTIDRDQARATIAYAGSETEVVVRSVWELRGDRFQMVEAIPPET